MRYRSLVVAHYSAVLAFASALHGHCAESHFQSFPTGDASVCLLQPFANAVGAASKEIVLLLLITKLESVTWCQLAFWGRQIADLEEAFRKQHVMQRALMLCALGPEPASQAMRALHNIDADGGIFVIDRAASAGNAHWVCSWFAVADNHKMKPKRISRLRNVSQTFGSRKHHL
jgi:hypothetical protein